MDVVSLGMLTLDDIVRDGAKTHEAVLGGAGTYAVVGARLMASQERTKRIGWIVHMGHDFPPAVRATIDSWAICTKYIETFDRQTTRATNAYVGEDRAFAFATPKMHVDQTMLDEDFLQARVFHIIATPSRCISLVLGIQSRRKELRLDQYGFQPLFVWEPMESSCNPANVEHFREALKLIDVFSPNEKEFVELTGAPVQADGIVVFSALHDECSKYIEACNLEAYVVRLGSRGVFVAQRGRPSLDRILPAYFPSPGDPSHSKVVDVTGGGNAFLGGFCVALANQLGSSDLNTYEMSSVYGAVAASYAIEQFGMPQLESDVHGCKEKWNGQAVSERVNHYLQRFGSVKNWPLGH